VVDTGLHVHGTSNLRVADASVMPAPISANTNATVYAIAERAAELIRS
jgi:choline dehydrogenase